MCDCVYLFYIFFISCTLTNAFFLLEERIECVTEVLIF